MFTRHGKCLDADPKQKPKQLNSKSSPKDWLRAAYDLPSDFELRSEAPNAAPCLKAGKGLGKEQETRS